MEYRIISADNHINEPRDLFTARLPEALRERAPRVLEHPEGGEGWSFDGKPPKRRYALEAVAGRSLGEILAKGGLRFDEILPGNYDPAAHLRDMDVDGVDAVVVYPAYATHSYLEPDRELGLACLRAYNDWMLEDFEACDRARLLGLPMLPTDDGEEAMVREFDRLVRKGARALFLPGLPVIPYHDAFYEPLWQRAVADGVTLTFHRTFGGAGRQADEFSTGGITVAGIVDRWFSAVRPLTYMIFAGTFERHPSLKLVAAEVNCGWLPFWMEMMDQQHELQDAWTPVRLSRPPSSLVGRNVFVTVLNDRTGWNSMALDERVLNASLYSTDYPHSVTLWPHSKRWIEELGGGLDESSRRQVLSGNALRVYRFQG
jgi:predicted TIM-barrel fold metal-dependent hydrolase